MTATPYRQFPTPGLEPGSVGDPALLTSCLRADYPNHLDYMGCRR